jgi:dTDP-4-amino-4,6-dideoxygalactose transaminase
VLFRSVRLALEAANIEARPLWKPMHMQPVFESFPYFGGSISENLFADGLCLPSGSNLTDAHFDHILKVLKSIFSTT